MLKPIRQLTLGLAVLAVITALYPGSASALPTNFAFPVIGDASFSNDFSAPRASGVHHAIDIFAKKHSPIIAAVSGTVTFAPATQPSYGWIVNITDDDGYIYRYIHINNDHPGTDDGKGGPMFAYAPYMRFGNRVVRGQHLGYVGDSGNAENTPPHLHFEIERPNGSFFNPYNELTEATRKSKPVEPPAYPFEILPYGGLKSGLNVAMGDTDGDNDAEIITAPGRGGGPHVKIFRDDHIKIKGFFAYNQKLRMGIDVAAADLDADGEAEIITAPGPGVNPHVKMFKADGTYLGGFLAYSINFKGGVRIAAADVDGDDRAEIITGPMPGGTPHVKVFRANGTLLSGFAAYNPDLRDGIDVAAGDTDGDGVAEVVTVPGRGSGPSVKVFEYNGMRIGGFLAFDSLFRGGARVSVGNVQLGTGSEEIAVSPESVGGSSAKLFNGSGTKLDTDVALETWWRGYYDIAAGRNSAYFGTGINRRASAVEVFD